MRKDSGSIKKFDCGFSKIDLHASQCRQVVDQNHVCLKCKENGFIVLHDEVLNKILNNQMKIIGILNEIACWR